MSIQAYSVFDTKSLQYHLPWFQPTDGAAVRILHDLVNDPNTQMGRHPSDFVLYCIGDYDALTGQMAPVSPLRHVIDAVALVRVQPELPFGAQLQADAIVNKLNGEAK